MGIQDDERQVLLRQVVAHRQAGLAAANYDGFDVLSGHAPSIGARASARIGQSVQLRRDGYG